MKTECDKLRTRAWAQGEGSAEYDAWLHHAEHCPDCQAEIDLMNLLAEDAKTQRVHLSRENVSVLTSKVKERYGHSRWGHARRLVMSTCWKVCAAAAFVALLLQMLPQRTASEDSLAMPLEESAQLEMAQSREAELAQEEMDRDASLRVLRPGQQPSVMARVPDFSELFPTQAFDHQIRLTQKRIRSQRTSLDELIDRDLKR